MKEKVNDWFTASNDFRMSDVQRDYVWEVKKALDLFETIKNNEDAFLGGISYRVCTNSYKHEEFVISDGCQRLTTLLLIRKVLYGNSDILIDALRRSELHYTFADKRDTECLLKIMLDEIDNLGQLGKRPLAKNFRALKKIVEKEENLDELKLHLGRAKLYSMEIPDSCDEVEVFINLNSKGRKVEVPEIIKAYFQDENASTYNRYNAIKNRLDDINNAFMEKFLKCNAENSEKLLDYYSSKNCSISDLEFSSRYFEEIVTDSYVPLLNGKNLPIKVLSWLLKLYKSNNPESEGILRTVMKWLYFNCPYIAAQSANNNRFQCLEENYINQISLDISQKEIYKKLQYFYNNPEIIDFKGYTYKGLTYSLGNRFIIRVYEDMGYMTSHLNNLTVEHIYAQNCVLGKIDEDHLHKLGNLTLLNQKLNSSVGKNPPVDKFKMEAYSLSGFQPTLDLINLTKWELKDIDERHKILSDVWITKMNFVEY